MPLLKTYSLFISHSWKYSSQYYNIYNLLREKPLFKFRNMSIPNHDPLNTKFDYELEQHLVRRMKMSHVAIFIGGMYCNYSKWIKKELNYAKRHNIPIVVILPRGQNSMPSYLRTNANHIISWNSGSLISAVRDCVR